MKKKYPQFVSMGGSALRLTKNNSYYRDGGCYDVYFEEDINGDLISKFSFESQYTRPLIPITKKEWEKSNGPYAPKVYEIVGWEKDEICFTNPCGEIILPESKVIKNDKRKYLLIRK
jgi:hypothetical protein